MLTWHMCLINDISVMRCFCFYFSSPLPPSWGLDLGLCTCSVKASITWLCCTPNSQVELDDKQKSWGWTWPKDGSELYMFHSGAWAISMVSPLICKVNVVAYIAFYYCDLFTNTLCWLLPTLLLPFKLWNLLFFLHSQLTGSVGAQKEHPSVVITHELS